MLIPVLDFVLLFVANPLQSAAFYSKLLGIKPIEQAPTFALFAFPNGIKLGLWSCKTAEPKVIAQAGSCEIAFSQKQKSDVDMLYQQWLALGICMLQVPTDMDFGRTFVALDPDGHRIRVFYPEENA